METLIRHINFWVTFGFVGQLLFGSRFFIQWIVSEKRGESIIPELFWYFSMAGSVLLFSYAIHKRDPVFIMGQCSGIFIYTRNIMLIFKKKRLLTTATGCEINPLKTAVE
ncbi:MAG: lipid A biosynthesis protein [Candidatus Brocadia carolinensis]|uniref:Lipid A biosynthesis protein n=1 Tax=Candidatus Brocadia carolinensis TaxID=1004156 RepID=A0A1V4AW21_9BACT|nr:MAG: lipid A biosynthesis protein [Candidatus Brocadia caroliniensis]